MSVSFRKIAKMIEPQSVLEGAGVRLKRSIAGRGILHEEMPKPVQGQMAGFQLWVNLPARLNMSVPKHKASWLWVI